MRYKQFCGRKRNETGIIYILPKCLPNNSSKSGPMMRECLEIFILAADNGRKRWIFAMKGILCCRQFRKKHDLRIFMWIKKRRLFNKWRKILRTWLTALTSKAAPYILPIKIKPSVDEKGGPFLKSRVAGERLAFAFTDGISRASERKIFYLNRQGFGDACSR